MKNYNPRPGTRAALVIEALADAPEGIETVELARIVGGSPKNLANHLDAAVRAGVVKWERVRPGEHSVPRRWKLTGHEQSECLAGPAPAGPTMPTHPLDRWMILRAGARAWAGVREAA